MGWPAGLKLNSNLSKFLGEMFLWLISVWTVLLSRCLASMELVVRLVALSGLTGFSSMLSLIIDLATAFTLHVYLFYLAASRIFSWTVRILNSLFHLFRGKKWNVLRERLDSADYDLDQLLLGTILFTLLMFIFPTVAVYYFLFLASHLAWTTVKLALRVALLVTNEVPLFELAMRIASPDAIVGGLHIDVAGSQLVLRPHPRSLGTTMRPLRGAVLDLGHSLVNWANLRRLLRGEPIETGQGVAVDSAVPVVSDRQIEEFIKVIL